MHFGCWSVAEGKNSALLWDFHIDVFLENSEAKGRKLLFRLTGLLDVLVLNLSVLVSLGVLLQIASPAPRMSKFPIDVMMLIQRIRSPGSPHSSGVRIKPSRKKQEA